jgi:hypothetical protein
MAFRAGQKIVCINDTGNFAPWAIVAGASLNGLKKGTIYTVRAIGDYAGQPNVWLCEITRPIEGNIGRRYGESGYAPQRFRLAAERKTDIAIFKKMLAPKRQSELAE